MAAAVTGAFALGAFWLSVSEAPVQQSLFTTSTNWFGRQQSLELSGLQDATASSLPLVLDARVSLAPAFVWPAHGDITSYMDADHPMGIDIGLDGDSVSPIVSAAAGVVQFAGGSDAHAYGYFIRVDHGDGLVTLYAHLSEILVSAGQTVEQGQVLGFGGSSGKATGKHLHFEVRVGDQLADPLRLLPGDAPPQIADFQCGSGDLVMTRGDRASLDFSHGLPAGTKIAEAAITPAGPSTATPAVMVAGDGVVLISSRPEIVWAGSEAEESYTLNMVLVGASRDERTCRLRLATLSSNFVQFSEASVRAASSNSAYEAETPAPAPVAQPPVTEVPPASPTPEHTPTPPPTPTGIPLLGEASTPTSTPTLVPPKPTSTPTASETPSPSPTASPTATKTPTPSPTATTTPNTTAQ